MIKVRTALHSHLTGLTSSSVYFQVAPDTASYPYAVYDFQLYDFDESSQRITMDVDAWDDEVDTTALDTLIAEVDVDKDVISTIDYVLYNNVENIDMDSADYLFEARNEFDYFFLGELHYLSIVLFRESRIPLTDEDEKIKRRRYSYAGFLHERS